MPVPFEVPIREDAAMSGPLEGDEPVPRRWEGGEGKGRRDKRRRVSSRTVAGSRTGQGRAEENSFIMDAFFKTGGKKMQRRRGYY